MAFAAGDIDLARRCAGDALAAALDGEIRCHALEVLGRIARITDLPAARAHFEQALAVADAGDLAIWRMRALHELGTIDMFEHLGSERLLSARARAEELGALTTMAVLDVQLSALSMIRWEPDACEARAGSALALAEMLGIDGVREKAYLFLAEAAALRGDGATVERYAEKARSCGTPGGSVDGFALGFRGEAALMSGDIEAAMDYLERGIRILDAIPQSEPAAFRATWPLLLAAAADPRAEDAIGAVRLIGGSVKPIPGLLAYAEAVLSGREGDRERAELHAADAERSFVNCTPWRSLGRMIVADAAIADGWGQPAEWLADCVETFEALHLPQLAGRCRSRMGGPGVDRWGRAAITARESDVLVLVADALTNKEIAARLRISDRTVEKHIEALLRKTGSRSRTQLAVWASEAQMPIAARKP